LTIFFRHEYEVAMPKVLVLGKGLIGSAVSEHLKQDNRFEVEVHGKTSLDLRDSHELQNLLKRTRPEIVVIAAGVVGSIQKNSSEPYLLGMENSRITLNTIEMCTRLNVPQVLNLVPACVYPSNINRRMRPEDLWTGPMEVASLPYSTAKILGITLVNAAREQNNSKWVSVIATNLYGDDSSIETHKAHVIPELLKKFTSARIEGKASITLMGDGSPVREFLHVDDFASAIRYIITNEYYSDPVVNVSGTSSWTISDLASIMKDVTKFQGEIIFANDGRNGALVKLLDGSRLHSMGWAPEINLPQGVARVYEKFKI
jgi:GDP-L-fucose synthase